MLWTTLDYLQHMASVNEIHHHCCQRDLRPHLVFQRQKRYTANHLQAVKAQSSFRETKMLI